MLFFAFYITVHVFHIYSSIGLCYKMQNLSEDDWWALIDSIFAPPKPNDAIREAFQHYIQVNEEDATQSKTDPKL